MVVEQKFKVLRKAEKKIYQDMNQIKFESEIETNFAEFCELVENSRACYTHLIVMYFLEPFLFALASARLPAVQPLTATFV